MSDKQQVINSNIELATALAKDNAPGGIIGANTIGFGITTAVGLIGTTDSGPDPLETLSTQLTVLQNSVNNLITSVNDIKNDLKDLTDLNELNQMIDNWRADYQTLKEPEAEILGFYSTYKDLIQNQKSQQNDEHYRNWANRANSSDTLRSHLEYFNLVIQGDSHVSDELEGLFEQWEMLLWREICEVEGGLYQGPLYERMESHFLSLMAPQTLALIMLVEANNFLYPSEPVAANIYTKYREMLRKQTDRFAHSVGRMAVRIQNQYWRNGAGGMVDGGRPRYVRLYPDGPTLNIPEFYFPNTQHSTTHAFHAPPAILKCEETISGILGYKQSIAFHRWTYKHPTSSGYPTVEEILGGFWSRNNSSFPKFEVKFSDENSSFTKQFFPPGIDEKILLPGDQRGNFNNGNYSVSMFNSPPLDLHSREAINQNDIRGTGWVTEIPNGVHCYERLVRPLDKQFDGDSEGVDHVEYNTKEATLICSNPIINGDITHFKDSFQGLSVLSFNESSSVMVWYMPNWTDCKDSPNWYGIGKDWKVRPGDYDSTSIVGLIVSADMDKAGTKPLGLTNPTFTRLELDLNKKAGGDDIYLYYENKSEGEIREKKLRPITEIKFIKGKNASAPSGWGKIDIDLNEDAGGEYIYLCYKFGEPGSASSAIAKLKLIEGSNSRISAPSGYTKINQDLNEDAGGSYIYLCHLNNSKEVPILEEKNAVIDVVIHSEKSSNFLSKANTPDALIGYRKISTDLNLHAGGNDIHLYYKLAPEKIVESHNLQSITDIRFITGKNTRTPSGYTKIDIDLNQKAGGKYIYLCYKKGANGSTAGAISDLKIITSLHNRRISAPAGYTKINQDLNEKAGGDYIYLCYK